MKRHFAICVAFLCLCALSVCAFADAPGRLVPESDANAVGMTRAWFAQATVLRGREEITSVNILDGVILTTSDGGRLEAFDAETGVKLWTVDCGEGHLLPPAINSRVVVAISGTDLLVFDRFTGRKLSETALYGNPSAAPVCSEREIYVPLFSQRIMTYSIVREKVELKKVADTVQSMTDKTKDLGVAGDYWAKKFAKYNEDLEAASYAIEDIDKKHPYSCASFGIVGCAPVMGTQSYELDVVGWTTDQGWLMLGEYVRRTVDDPFKLLYKLQARPNFSYVNSSRVGNKALIPRDDVQMEPFFVPYDRSVQASRLDPESRKGGMFIIGSESGHVYAMNDISGKLLWTYLTMDAVSDRISAFDDHVYIPTESGAYYAVDLKTGLEVWRASDVKKTIAASSARLYTVDSRGRLVIIDRTNGNREKVLNIGQTKFQVFNQETDRVYIVSSDGLIQCLHETQLAEPIRHRETCKEINDRILAQMEKNAPAKKEKATVPQTTVNADDDEDSADSSASDEDDPFGEDSGDSADSSASDEDDPFGEDSGDEAASDSNEDASDSGADDDPFGADSGDEEDPFGDF